MGTNPNYVTPKTNWQAGDIPAASHFNNIEGNIQAIEEGSRTIDPAQTPSSNAGTLRQLLDWFANRIKAITGKTNWWDVPDTSLAAAKSHIDAAAPHTGHETPAGAQAKVDTHEAKTSTHGATSAATASRIMMRDTTGRAKVAAPSASDDIARKAEVDDVQSNLTSHLDETMPHEFTDGATTYRWGLAVIDGVVNMVYEEVV